jgi:hypothetical protein
MRALSSSNLGLEEDPRKSHHCSSLSTKTGYHIHGNLAPFEHTQTKQKKMRMFRFFTTDLSTSTHHEKGPLQWVLQHSSVSHRTLALKMLWKQLFLCSSLRDSDVH